MPDDMWVVAPAYELDRWLRWWAELWLAGRPWAQLRQPWMLMPGADSCG